MSDKAKTKAQLIGELTALRQHVVELEDTAVKVNSEGKAQAPLTTQALGQNGEWRRSELSEINLDLTLHRQAETALQENGAWKRAIFDSVTAHIALLDREGNIIVVNSVWERFAQENGDLELSHTCIGINYLDICRRANEEQRGRSPVTTFNILVTSQVRHHRR